MERHFGRTSRYRRRFAARLTCAVRPLHDKMVALVERMPDLHWKLAAATIPADKRLYQRQIEVTDAEIHALVYELYGLTGEEIAIVEGRDHSTHPTHLQDCGGSDSLEDLTKGIT